MDRTEKQKQIEHLREVFQGSVAGFLTSFLGLRVEEMNTLRSLLRKEGATYLVVKNTLAKKALIGTILESASPLFEGPTGMVYTKGDPTAPAKILRAYAKDKDKLVIKGGFIEGRPFGPKDLDAIANLPGKNDMRAMMLNTFMGVPRSLVSLMNQVPSGFVRLLEARRESLEKGAEAPQAEG